MATILVVEDDPLIRELLTRLLRIERYAVITAVDGESGVRVASTYRPHLIIMDIGLPILDGLQATQRLRAMPSMQTVPIIALSAAASDEHRIAGLQAGCDVYQTKPIAFTELLHNIRTLLGRAPKT